MSRKSGKNSSSEWLRLLLDVFVISAIKFKRNVDSENINIRIFEDTLFPRDIN